MQPQELVGIVWLLTQISALSELMTRQHPTDNAILFGAHSIYNDHSMAEIQPGQWHIRGPYSST